MNERATSAKSESMHADESQTVVFANQTLICELCHYSNDIQSLRVGHQVDCLRCGHTLMKAHLAWPARMMALSLAAFVMFMMAALFPLIGFSANGISQTIRLFAIVQMLLSQNFVILSAIVLLFLIVLPLSFVFVGFYLSCGWLMQRPLWGQRWGAHWLTMVKPWLMADVFLIGILVALIKLHSLADIKLGLSFWAYSLFVVLFTRMMSLVDEQLLWHYCVPHVLHRFEPCAHDELKRCQSCGLTLEVNQDHCPRCHHHFKAPLPFAMQRTLALLIAAIAMYIPANFFPIMTTQFLDETHHSTIMGGVLLLWEMKSYPVALVIFVASILVPTIKIFALAGLCWQSYHPQSIPSLTCQRFYSFTELIGRWSMIDIFVVAILTALVQLGGVMNIQAGPAALPFAWVVIFTMLAAMSFNSQWLWTRKSITAQEHKS